MLDLWQTHPVLNSKELSSVIKFEGTQARFRCWIWHLIPKSVTKFATLPRKEQIYGSMTFVGLYLVHSWGRGWAWNEEGGGD